MAPRKAAKASGSATPKKAPTNKSGSKKSAVGSRPALPATAYAVVKSKGYGYDGFHAPEPPTTSMPGVYLSKDQAYVAAIQNFISEMEHIQSGERPDLREIATTKTLSLKQRLRKIESTQGGDDEQIEFHIKKTQVFPLEKVNEVNLPDAIKPTSEDYCSDYASSHEDDDCSVHSSEEEDDEEEDDGVNLKRRRMSEYLY